MSSAGATAIIRDSKICFFLLLVVNVISFGECRDSVFWSNDRHVSLQGLRELLASRSVERPLVLFLLSRNFDLFDFSRLANVYSENPAPLQIPNLTKWISSSKGYSGQWIKDDIETVLSEIPYTEIFDYKDTTEKTAALDRATVIVVHEDSLISVDSKVDDVLSSMGSRKFRAILTGTNNEKHQRKRRDTSDSDDSSSTESKLNSTFINGSVCLFYTQEVWVTVERQSSSDPIVHVVIDSPGEGICHKLHATVLVSFMDMERFSIQYSGSWTDSSNEITVTKLTLEVVLQGDSSGYWYLTNISVVELEIQGQDTWNVTTKTSTGVNHLGIWSKMKMAYACWQTPTAWIKNKTESELLGETRIGVSFNHFEVQPFGVKNGKFTDAVDDCVEFFTIGTWMGIFCGLIIITIMLFAIAMISNLKTMDRFDDPKGRPIQINTKD